MSDISAFVTDVAVRCGTPDRKRQVGDDGLTPN